MGAEEKVENIVKLPRGINYFLTSFIRGGRKDGRGPQLCQLLVLIAALILLSESNWVQGDSCTCFFFHANNTETAQQVPEMYRLGGF